MVATEVLEAWKKVENQVTRSSTICCRTHTPQLTGGETLMLLLSRPDGSLAAVAKRVLRDSMCSLPQTKPNLIKWTRLSAVAWQTEEGRDEGAVVSVDHSGRPSSFQYRHFSLTSFLNLPTLTEQIHWITIIGAFDLTSAVTLARTMPGRCC